MVTLDFKLPYSITTFHLFLQLNSYASADTICVRALCHPNLTTKRSKSHQIDLSIINFRPLPNFNNQQKLILIIIIFFIQSIRLIFAGKLWNFPAKIRRTCKDKACLLQNKFQTFYIMLFGSFFQSSQFFRLYLCYKLFDVGLLLK